MTRRKAPRGRKPKRMNLPEYVSTNWDKLPKSTFNEQELVMVKEMQNEDWSYGHHSYEGYGLDREGNLHWCYSSGCSCEGSCGADHQKTAKTFEIDWPEEFQLDPETIEYSRLQVNFSDY